jgi:hypothetical protein
MFSRKDVVCSVGKAMSVEFTENQLAGLMNFISGEAHIFIGGHGIHTYPDGDERTKRLFAGCEELEKRGLVRRYIDEPGHVYFLAVGNKISA